jgi:hypothetical protein
MKKLPLIYGYAALLTSALLQPASFHSVSSIFLKAASYMLVFVPSVPKTQV